MLATGTSDTSDWQFARLPNRPQYWRATPTGAAVALATRMARIAWTLMARGEAYDITRAQPTMAAA